MRSTPKLPARSPKLVLSAAAMAASQLVLLAFSAGAAHAAITTTAWGTPEVVPGIGSLNTGGLARFFSMSCASAGNCSAGGTYIDQSGNTQALIVNDVNGTWGTAFEVPGTAALNTGGDAELFSVSCASAGNCAAGGWYVDNSGRTQAFVVSEVNGTWGTAVEVPGTAALNTGGLAEVLSVSCASAGNCSAGGTYAHTVSGSQEAFVVREVNGTWGTAVEVPGTAALNTRANAFVFSVSCASPGNCGAGGTYYDGAVRAFVVSEVNGAWKTAIEVPGTAALRPGGPAEVVSASCASPGNCSAGGTYADGLGHIQGFVVNEVHGTWRTAIEVPGIAALNNQITEFHGVSCASAGNCSAGGTYTDGSGRSQVFVVNEVNGTWRTAIEVPGTAALNNGGFAGLESISCASAGNCSAGGFLDHNTLVHAFVVSEVNGTWKTATMVPPPAPLGPGGGTNITALSCAPRGTCSAGGSYDDKTGNTQVFVVSQS